ncbi:hypothetical protein H9P43_007006 [Blastocladiella emersonii ATCC 22665]|nr:hypothetical protein H9P43_007006 [Blastocladiella emersonii ATCC 22665]
MHSTMLLSPLALLAAAIALLASTSVEALPRSTEFFHGYARGGFTPRVTEAKGMVRRDITGRATWYDVGVGLGSCLWYNTNEEDVVALAPNHYSKDKCGKCVIMTNGKVTHTATVKFCDETEAARSAGVTPTANSAAESAASRSAAAAAVPVPAAPAAAAPASTTTTRAAAAATPTGTRRWRNRNRNRSQVDGVSAATTTGDATSGASSINYLGGLMDSIVDELATGKKQ